MLHNTDKKLGILTAVKSGFNSITLSKSEMADFAFPRAKYTVPLLKYVK